LAINHENILAAKTALNFSNNCRKTDPLPAMLGDFSDPKEPMFSKPRREL